MWPWNFNNIFSKRVITEAGVERFSRIQQLDDNVHILWIVEKHIDGHRKYIRDIAKLNCVPYGQTRNIRCVYCETSTNDQLNHYFHYCAKCKCTRELFWNRLINEFSGELSPFIYKQDEHEVRAMIILGKKLNMTIEDQELLHLVEVCTKTWQWLAYKKELCFYANFD